MRDAMRVAVVLVAMLSRRTSKRGGRLYRLGKRRVDLVRRMRVIKVLLWPSRRHHRADGLLEDSGGVHPFNAAVEVASKRSRRRYVLCGLQRPCFSWGRGEKRSRPCGRRHKSRIQFIQRDVSARLSEVDIEGRGCSVVIGHPVGGMDGRMEGRKCLYELDCCSPLAAL